MSKATHFILSEATRQRLYMYDVKTHKVFHLSGEYYTTMSQNFTDRLLNGKSVYGLKKVITQLENK